MSGILAIIVIAGIIQIWLPWWSLAIVAFVVGIFCSSAARALRDGLTGAFLLWLLVTLYLYNQDQAGLTAQITSLLQLPASWLLIFFTALIGGAVGAMACFSGYQLKLAFIQQPAQQHQEKTKGEHANG